MTGELQDLLAPLRLYNLEEGSLVDCELRAYEAGLAIVEELLGEILQMAFVQTAAGESLLRHEKLVGLQERRGVSVENRRELVLYRLSTSPFDFTLEGMVSSVRGAGMEAEIQENYEGESLTIVSRRLIDEFLDLDGVKASLDTVLPAHLRAEYDIGVLTWDMLDERDGVWDGWDELDLHWSEFDMNGHNYIPVI